MAVMNVEMAEMIRERTKTPFASFDGDQTDPRNFSEAQFDTRVEALSEVMEQNMANAENQNA